MFNYSFQHQNNFNRGLLVVIVSLLTYFFRLVFITTLIELICKKKQLFKTNYLSILIFIF